MPPITSVAIVAPSSLPTQEQMQSVLDDLPKAYPHIHFKNHVEMNGKLSQEQRFDLLWKALLDPEVELIWAIRGGSGCAELIPYIHERRSELSHLKPKTLLGFSDVTALLYYWEQNLKWPAIHGSGAAYFATQRIDQASRSFIDQFLMGKLHQISIVCNPLNPLARKDSIQNLSCFAGNLTLFSLAGRELWEPRSQDQDFQKFKDSILIIEDVSEPTYKVERAFRHLQRTHFLNCRALVIGDFFCNPLHADPERNQKEVVWLQDFFESFAKELDIPVYQTNQVGHGEANYLIPLGWRGAFKQELLILRPS